MKILQFWAGPMPEIVAWARWTLKAYHESVTVDLPENLLARFRVPGPVQYSVDALRAHYLMRHYGDGLQRTWIDSDFVCFGDIRPVISIDNSLDAVIFADIYKGENEYENDFVSFRAGSHWAFEFASRVEDVVKARVTRALAWGDLGRHILNKMMQDPRYRLRAKIVYPDQVSLFRGMTNAFDQDCPDEFINIPPGCVGLQLCHSLSGEYLKEKTVGQWRDTETMIGAIIRTAEKRIGAVWKGEK